MWADPPVSDRVVRRAEHERAAIDRQRPGLVAEVEHHDVVVAACVCEHVRLGVEKGDALAQRSAQRDQRAMQA